MGAEECIGIKGSIVKVSKFLVCRGCTGSEDRTSMHIRHGASLDLVDRVCYLRDHVMHLWRLEYARDGLGLDILCLCLAIKTSHFL